MILGTRMHPSEDEGAFLITFLCETEFFGKSSLSDAYLALKLTEFVSESSQRRTLSFCRLELLKEMMPKFLQTECTYLLGTRR